jgi:hypothetical protein
MMDPKEDLYNWIVDNFKEVAQDIFSEIAEKYAKENEWDIVEVHFMIEELVEETKKGILNVVDTYEFEEVE